MTHLKTGQDTDKKKAISDDEKRKKKTACWKREYCLQSCAWILLTTGLCIIVITFYLTLKGENQRHFQHNIPASADEENFIYAAAVSESGPVLNTTGSFGIVDDVKTDQLLVAKHDGRLVIEDIFGAISSNFVGCQEKLCKIACSNDGNLFSSLYKTMKSSSCPSIDIMLIEGQEFPNGILKNSWHSTNRSVHEVIIRSSNLTKIKSNAFNSAIFRNTLLMSWSKLNIQKVESGALLGLYKLKYLTIDSTIRTLESALFQPVQTTLTHLKLNGNRDMEGNRNPFGITQLSKLEYLDLSHNRINGSLGRRMFHSTPNLKHLLIVDAKLQAIKHNTFAKLAKKLIFLNLSKNLLTTLTANTILPIVLNEQGAMLSLSHNRWKCDCDLKALSEVYKNYRNQFMDAVYCSAPHTQYGVSIDKVKYEKQNCEQSSTTVQGPVEEKEDEQAETTKSSTTTKLYSETPPMDFDSSDVLDSGEVTSEETSNVLKMRCVESTSPSSSPSSSSSSSTSSSTSTSSSSTSTLTPSSRSAEYSSRNSEDTVLKFPAPDHEFDLLLFPENNTVLITIENPKDLMIIWFSDQQESSSVTYNDMSVDYECMRYAQPNLIVGPLVDNTTYTFCLIPRYQSSISPFNCLPLHVPMKRDDNIWISQDNKKFTIGMLCLIFFVSTVAGALIAYFGIKNYPDLLEGSKNVLVVKKPEQACYVATISETDYLKNSSLLKRKSSAKEGTQSEESKAAVRKKSSIKLPLPTSPCAKEPELPPSAYHAPVKNLESVSSDMSSATCFEDTFPECFLVHPDDYETPKVCENFYTLEQRMVPPHYNMSPGSPPPLPKRNSNISDSSTVILNRFSRNM